MTLSEAVVAFIEARAAIQANCPEARKFAVIHGGKGYFFNVDPVQGVGVAVSDALPIDGAAPAAEAKAPRKKAEKTAAPIPGPGSAAEASAAPATTAAPAMTKDKFRAFAREVAAKIGIEECKRVLGAPIDNIAPESYAELVTKLEAAAATVL